MVFRHYAILFLIFFTGAPSIVCRKKTFGEYRGPLGVFWHHVLSKSLKSVKKLLNSSSGTNESSLKICEQAGNGKSRRYI